MALIRNLDRVVRRGVVDVVSASHKAPASLTGAGLLGLVAVGALAVGAVAIGRMAVGQATIHNLRVEHLSIGEIAADPRRRRRRFGRS